mgnify:CR=1 FL=1
MGEKFLGKLGRVRSFETKRQKQRYRELLDQEKDKLRKKTGVAKPLVPQATQRKLNKQVWREYPNG